MVMEIKNHIFKIVKENPKYFHFEIKKHYKEYLENLYPNLPIKQQVYRFLYEPIMKCIICGSSDLYFLNISEGYSKTCSKKCGAKYRANTNQLLYGVQNPSQRKEIKQKQIDTLVKNYGVKNPSHIPGILEKKKKTNIKKYGVDNFSKTQQYKDKTILTNNKKYGADYHMQTPGGKEKIKRSCIKNLGVFNPSQNSNVKSKKVQTNLQKYGKDYYSQTEQYKNKTKQTNIKKYNTEFASQHGFSQQARDILLNKQNLELALEQNTPVQLAEKLGVAFSTVYNHAINFGIRSKYADFSTEMIMKQILDELEISYKRNDRIQIKPKELDFYIQDHNIAIEVCGLYWHSEEAGKNRLYHLNKLEECERKNIRLITVFEDELQDYEKIKNRFKHIFKKNTTSIFARKCTIKKVNFKEIEQFLCDTHIQGITKSQINYAALYDGEIIAAMTFGKLRSSLGNKHQDGSFELIRFASKGNVIGIANKLFKRFIQDHSPNQVISYSDRRWNTGNLYKIMGFVFQHNTKPNYWYSKDKISRLHRYGFTKHRVIEMGGDALLSESQNMKNMGYIRIWDCGSSKWIWSNPNPLKSV